MLRLSLHGLWATRDSVEPTGSNSQRGVIRGDEHEKMVGTSFAGGASPARALASYTVFRK